MWETIDDKDKEIELKEKSITFLTDKKWISHEKITNQIQKEKTWNFG